MLRKDSQSEGAGSKEPVLAAKTTQQEVPASRNEHDRLIQQILEELDPIATLLPPSVTTETVLSAVKAQEDRESRLPPHIVRNDDTRSRIRRAIASLLSVIL